MKSAVDYKFFLSFMYLFCYLSYEIGVDGGRLTIKKNRGQVLKYKVFESGEKT